MFGNNNTMFTMTVLWMLSEALPIILIYLGKVMKYSSGNGCLSMPHIIILPVRGGSLNADICNEI